MPKIIRPEQLGAAMQGEAKGVLQAIRRGARLAAHRGRSHLVSETDRKGIVDRGQYRNSFRVLPESGNTMATLVNDSPMAGVIEMGARPHKVSKEGLEAIAAWVRRKLTIASGPARVVTSKSGKTRGVHPKIRITKDEAMGIARAIASKIAREGQKAKHVVGDALPDLTRFLREEVEAQLRKRGGA